MTMLRSKREEGQSRMYRESELEALKKTTTEIYELDLKYKKEARCRFKR